MNAPCVQKDLKVAASFVHEASLDPRGPQCIDNKRWLMIAWRLARRGALLRGLLSEGRGGQNLTELALRESQPFERPFEFEREPTNAALLHYLRHNPCPLLPCPVEHQTYYEILAEDLDVEGDLHALIGLHQFMHYGPPTLDELRRFEPRVIRQCGAMVKESGIAQFAEEAEIRWHWQPSESQAALAQVIHAQAEDISIHDPATLMAAQIQAMERLAANMEKGFDPDLRGAAMIRREIARLLLKARTESNDTAELARFIAQLGPELEKPTPTKAEEVKEEL